MGLSFLWALHFLLNGWFIKGPILNTTAVPVQKNLCALPSTNKGTLKRTFQLEQKTYSAPSPIIGLIHILAV
jgi:hypothetical protein